jgi:hypothetical protein
MYTTEEHIAPICERHGIPLNTFASDKYPFNSRINHLFMAVTVDVDDDIVEDDRNSMYVCVGVHNLHTCGFEVAVDRVTDYHIPRYITSYRTRLEPTRAHTVEDISPLLANMAKVGAVEMTHVNETYWLAAIDTVLGDFCRWRNRHYAARKIQLAWKRCVADPDYLVCKNRLLREHMEM